MSIITRGFFILSQQPWYAPSGPILWLFIIIDRNFQFSVYQVIKSLNRTYFNQKKKPYLTDMNPKAVTNDELFGYINPATREWKDGKCWNAVRLWNTGLVSSGASLTSWGEGASLALVGHPSSDGITIKMPYGVAVLHRPASHHIFSYWVG